MAENARYVRYQGIIPPEALREQAALVVGVGAIGRQVALTLATMGVGQIGLIDPDVVEPENLGTQGYRPDQVDGYKVGHTAEDIGSINPAVRRSAFTDRIQKFSGKLVSQLGDGNPIAVFCCVDSMASRRFTYRVSGTAGLFVDTRMTAEVARVIAVDSRPEFQDYYPSTLFSDSEAVEGPCTARSTYYCALVAAGLAVSEFTRWLRGEPILTDETLALPGRELILTQEAPLI